MKRRYRPCPIFDWQSPSRWLRPTSVRECRFLKEETLEQFALYPMPRYCWTLVMNIMISDIGWSPWHSQISGPWPLLGNRVPGENIRELGAWVPPPTYMKHLAKFQNRSNTLCSCHPIQMCACEPVSVGVTLLGLSKSPKTSIWGPSAGTLGKADGQPLASRGPRWNSPTTAILTQHWLFHNEHLTLN